MTVDPGPRECLECGQTWDDPEWIDLTDHAQDEHPDIDPDTPLWKEVDA